jgi:hypothetical protein
MLWGIASRAPQMHGGWMRPQVRFALDSPLEEAGFEPSVPLAKHTPPAVSKLLAETTTPRLTQYLGEMIARCERLAREVEAV